MPECYVGRKFNVPEWLLYSPARRPFSPDWIAFFHYASKEPKCQPSPNRDPAGESVGVSFATSQAAFGWGDGVGLF